MKKSNFFSDIGATGHLKLNGCVQNHLIEVLRVTLEFKLCLVTFGDIE